MSSTKYIVPEENFQKKPGAGPKEGDGKGVRKYPWRHRPIGKLAKVLIYLIQNRIYSDEVLVRDRKFKDVKPALLSGLQLYLPEIFQDYQEYTGHELTPEIIYDRLHKMYYHNLEPGCSEAKYSKEHPIMNKTLRPILGKVQERFKNNQFERIPVREIPLLVVYAH